jgi:methyl-accepting chemotaxis protein
LTDGAGIVAPLRETPRGRSYQLRIMAVSAAITLVSVLLMSAYLWVLLRFTSAQWLQFAAIVGVSFIVLFVAQAWTHQRLWSPLCHCLDARAGGRETESDLAEGFRAIMHLPAGMLLWGEIWWIGGGLLVAGAMALSSDGFRFFSGFVMVVAAGSGGFLMGLVHYFVMKRRLAPMRLQLAGEVGDPALRQSLIQVVPIRRKLVMTVAGTTCVVVLFSSLLSSVQAGRAVEGAAVVQQQHLIDRMLRDFAERGAPAIAEGRALAAELGIAGSVTLLAPDAADGSVAGIETSELAAMRGIGLERGDSLGFDSPNILTWRSLDDGRVLVLRTPWRVVEGMTQQAGWIFGVFLLLALGIAGTTAHLLAEDVAEATLVLGAEVDRMARGDLRRGRVWDSEDELGDLARGFEMMAQNLRRTVVRVADAADLVEHSAIDLSPVSEGIAEVTAAQVEAMQQAANSMEEIDAQVRGIAGSSTTLNVSVEESSSSVLELGASGHELNETVVRLHESIEGVSTSIEQLTRSVSQVTENTESLAEAAEETSASMEEMASSLREVDTSAEETSRLSEEVVGRAESGQAKVRETIEGMERIQDATETAEQVIRGLHSRTVEIGAIVDVIDGVADETSLLALNAAIIAAQAGEHGRAFSVVADEIKDLAGRVLASTKEIGGLISAVQSEAERATSAIEVGTASVANGVERSAEAGMALEAITRASRDSGTRMGGIVLAVQAQSQAAVHVVQLMEKVRSGVEHIREASLEQGRCHAVVSQSSTTIRDVAQQVRGTTEEQSRGANRIRESIEGVRDAVEQINDALQEQSQACASVLEGLESVQNRTRTNEEASRTLDGVTKVLRSHAEALREEVDRFQV